MPSFLDLSPETYIVFGRLTVAFGRLEGQLNWMMSLLLLHRDGPGHTPNAWRTGKRGSRRESWDADLSTKLEKVKALARECLPADLRDEVVRLAGTTKELSDERRRLVHAHVMFELSPPPNPVLSIFRTGIKGGAAIDQVNLLDVISLASQAEAAAQRALDLTGSVGDFSRNNPIKP